MAENMLHLALISVHIGSETVPAREPELTREFESDPPNKREPPSLFSCFEG